MTPGQLDTTIAELIRALDERKPDCMCQVSPRTAAVVLAHVEAMKKAGSRQSTADEALYTAEEVSQAMEILRGRHGSSALVDEVLDEMERVLRIAAFAQGDEA